MILNLQKHYLPQGIFCNNGPFTRRVHTNSRKKYPMFTFPSSFFAWKNKIKEINIMITITMITQYIYKLEVLQFFHLTRIL